VVKSGENLGAIAQRYGTTVSRLKSLNNLRTDRIRAGQKLVVRRG
jgi:LysM repeat protein